MSDHRSLSVVIVILRRLHHCTRPIHVVIPFASSLVPSRRARWHNIIGALWSGPPAPAGRRRRLHRRRSISPITVAAVRSRASRVDAAACVHAPTGAHLQPCDQSVYGRDARCARAHAYSHMHVLSPSLRSDGGTGHPTTLCVRLCSPRGVHTRTIAPLAARALSVPAPVARSPSHRLPTSSSPLVSSSLPSCVRCLCTRPGTVSSGGDTPSSFTHDGWVVSCVAPDGVSDRSPAYIYTSLVVSSYRRRTVVVSLSIRAANGAPTLCRSQYQVRARSRRSFENCRLPGSALPTAYACCIRYRVENA